MVKRKKRLKKGIESIEEQIRYHEEKLAKARENEDDILQRYYEKEIESLRKTLQKKENIFDKQ